MVSFRYHLVSLAAALLALAVGIVVGTTGLTAQPAASTAGPASVDASAEDLARQVAPRLTDEALLGQQVLLLIAPDAPASREVVAGLRAAGAEVTGQVRLAPALLDPANGTTVDDVVAGVLPAGLDLPATTALERAGTELAAALVTSSQGKEVDEADRQRVLGGFTGADLLSFDGAPPARSATLVLLLAGPARGSALASLAAAFQQRSGTVVAASSSAARGTGVLAVLRAGATPTSDVDGLGTAQGLLALVLALAEQVAGGAGHYGTGPGAGSVVPDLS